MPRCWFTDEYCQIFLDVFLIRNSAHVVGLQWENSDHLNITQQRMIGLMTARRGWESLRICLDLWREQRQKDVHSRMKWMWCELLLKWEQSWKTWRGFLVSCLIFDWRTDWIFIVWQKWVGIIICWKLNMVISLMYSTECFRISRSLGSLRSTLVVLKIF